MQNLALAAAAIGLAVAAPTSAQVYSARIIATGLNNPRGLAFGPDGALYVAESGVPLSSPGISTTGSITRILNGTQTRIATGLVSITSAMGEATGPNDITFANGVGYMVMGLGTDPAARAGSLGGGAALGLGGLYTFTLGANSTVTRLADISTYQGTTLGKTDSNPFHAVAGGSGLYLTDAGSNNLLQVTPAGALSLVASFPQHPVGPNPAADPVPTGVAVAPDGTIYVAELTGAPFTAGAANIYHLSATGTLLNTLTGFTDVTDIAIGTDGSMFVLEFDADGIPVGSPAGAVLKVSLDGQTRSTIFTGVTAGSGMTLGGDGSVYVTNLSPAAGVASIIQLTAVPEPATWAMMITGFGMVGFAMRRRQKVSVSYAA